MKRPITPRSSEVIARLRATIANLKAANTVIARTERRAS